MASFTIRNLDDSLKTPLRVAAANNNRTMEEEARIIRLAALTQKKPRGGLGTRIHSLFIGEAVDLQLPDRDAGT